MGELAVDDQQSVWGEGDASIALSWVERTFLKYYTKVQEAPVKLTLTISIVFSKLVTLFTCTEN